MAMFGLWETARLVVFDRVGRVGFGGKRARYQFGQGRIGFDHLFEEPVVDVGSGSILGEVKPVCDRFHRLCRAFSRAKM